MAHGHDGISINMLNMFTPFVAKPVNLIFQKCLIEGVFGNWLMFSMFTRNVTEILNPITGQYLFIRYVEKSWEKLFMMNSILFYFNNNLITKHQSGFKPGDSTINQLLSITTTISESFEE